MSRPLTRNEKNGTKLISKHTKDTATIIRKYNAGYVLNFKSPCGRSAEFALPFEGISLWEVSDQQIADTFDYLKIQKTSERNGRPFRERT